MHGLVCILGWVVCKLGTTENFEGSNLEDVKIWSRVARLLFSRMRAGYLHYIKHPALDGYTLGYTKRTPDSHVIIRRLCGTSSKYDTSLLTRHSSTHYLSTYCCNKHPGLSIHCGQHYCPQCINKGYLLQQ